MYHRFHGNVTHDSDGKWERMPHTGLHGVLREEFCGWQLRITHRRVGEAIRRDRYSVTIHRESPEHHEFLTGFSTKNAALAAARRRIDLLQNLSKRICIRRRRSLRAHFAGRRRPE